MSSVGCGAPPAEWLRGFAEGLEASRLSGLSGYLLSGLSGYLVIWLSGYQKRNADVPVSPRLLKATLAPTLQKQKIFNLGIPV